jgi:2'-5' RNA ligase
MRLFIAVNFSDELKKSILAVQEQLKERVSGGKFPPPENLHLTLVFLGETLETRLPEIRAVMETVKTPAFDLVFSRAGFFRRGRRELWRLAPGEDAPGLDRLREARDHLAAGLKAQGFSIDPRPFNAHITLGRELPRGLWPFETSPIRVPVRRISLMRSDRAPGRQVYAALFTQPLGQR